MSEFFLDDGLNNVFGLTPTIVAKSLTTQQIIQLLKALGADNIIEQETELIIPTICHNPQEHKKSHKLYYYFDNQIFTCYTGCQHSFNVYDLVRKVYAINDHEISFYEAYNYVLNYLDGKTIVIEQENDYISNRYARSLTMTQLPAYNKKVLNVFLPIAPTQWKQEGISVPAMDKYNILFSIDKFKIIIPHYDLDGRLIGIRGRTLDEYEIEHYGKYMPVKIEGIFYTHHLSRNLYGINITKGAIQRTGRAVLFEGEKSCLKMWDYYGEDSVAVAVCGNNLHKVQLDILVKQLGVTDITIAFDKEEDENYKYKLTAICEKYKNYANFSFLYDMENSLDIKDSPVDKGKEIYERLYNLRVKIR